VFVGTDRIQAFGLTNDTIVDDSVTGSGADQFSYVGSGWSHTPPGTSTATMGTFDGTVSTDDVAGDYATMTFTGSRVRVYADEASGYGSVTVSVDGGNAQTVSLANSTNSPNGQGEGDVLIYSLSGLGAGTHTLNFLNTGGAVALDRVEITPLPSTSSALGVSLTEGNVTPVPGGVLSYTVNYNNAGSIVDGTGTNATGAVLTETVPANTTADLGDSTPGWTLTSGSGGPGSTYTFAVGALNAGTTGSAVFTVDVNGTIPSGTSRLTDTVVLTDAASDSVGATRVTPLGVPVATSLAITQQPPGGETGAALTPAVAVAVRDQFGNTFTGDSSSTVTLTLNGGTFVGGGSTASATVSNGVATFANLAVSAPGTYTLTATDGSLPGATSSPFTVLTPAKLAFTQQPANGNTGVALSPPVAVAVEDASGTTVTGDSSTVTLTLNGGTFAGGGNTATAAAVHGAATFGGLVINAPGSYTLTATDGALTGATSNPFTVSAGTSVYLDFNAAATVFTSDFTVHNNGGANATSLSWGAAFGVQDQAGPSAGGGVESSGGVAIDSTAIYTPTKVNLSDGLVHTASEFVTAVSGLGTGDKPLQVGFLSPTSVGFNAGNSFISARILGNDTVEFQSANGGTAVSIDNTKPAGTINPGDWLELLFTTQETASGSFQGKFSLIDYGPAGTGAGTTVLAPVSYTVSGLTGLGTAPAVSPGFRTATPSSFTGHVRFDNFAVDPPPAAKLAYIQQPTGGTAGAPLGPFVVAVEDVAGHTISTDASTVTLTLSHGTFADGTTSVSTTAVNGVATFRNLVIDAAGSYVLRATDTNPNLDPGYAPFTIAGASQLAFAQQPSNTSAGAAISPAVTVAVEDPNGNTVPVDTSTVTLTLNGGTFAGGGDTVSAAAVDGVATFGNLVINAAGTYTLTATDGSLTAATSSPFTVTGQTAPAVGDAGFESPVVGAGNFQYAPAGTPWAFAGGAGVSGNGSAFTAGNPPAPEGAQVGLLQGAGSMISQSVSGWAAGTYTISFAAAQRGNFGTSREDFQVLVDGSVVGTFTPAGTSYATYTTAPFPVAAGSHTIAFQGLDTVGGDNTAFLDNVQVAVATGPPQPGDAGFESPVVGAGNFQYAPAGTPWAFAGGAGVSGNGSAFTAANPPAPEGAQVGFLQGTGSSSQADPGWDAGAYTISFQAAQRANYGTSREDFQVLVDGIVVGTFTPSGTAYSTYATAAFTVTAGSHTIALQGLDSAGGDNTAFLDDVLIAPASS
jgi:hypothetical protein